MTDGERELDPACELFLRGDPDFRSMTGLSRWWMPVGGVVIGVSTFALMNVTARRPFWAGIHQHIIAGAVGLFLGEWANGMRARFAAEKDYQYYHYMTLHPEDFPPPKKVYFRDYLEPWFPVR